ncbi:MAG: substrate-binding domain-containing protein [Caldilineaceae bacterium]
MVRENRVTIADIARKANVSKSTVSRVLNDAPAVNNQKRAAILAAIDELNYQPDLFARGLVSGQSQTIGVLTQNFGSPVYDAILRAILQGLDSAGYSSIFTDGRWQTDLENKRIQMLLNRRVDGLILLGGVSPRDELLALAQQTPLIIVARELAELRAQCVYIDNYAAAYQATQYLIKAGHQRIAHITGALSQKDAVERRDGYWQAMLDAGLAVEPTLIVEGNFRRQAGVVAVEMLLARQQTFSAIFAANDQMAFGARLALYRRGIRVPDDVSLIGFDDQPDAAYMIPPLTTMKQPTSEMGEAAAQAILQLLKGNTPVIPRFTAPMVLRESVANPR